MASSSGRIPQGEVIIDFADGGSFIRQRLDDAVLAAEKRKIERDERTKAQKAMEALKVTEGGAGGVSKDDVAFIVAQVQCTSAEAEQALREEKDLVKALVRLVKPRPRARSVDGGAEIKA